MRRLIFGAAALLLTVAASPNPPAPVFNLNNSTSTATGSTTARTMADRSANVVNIKDYGAVEDGTTDDSAAWAAAINRANTLNLAGNKVCVYQPAGVSVIKSTPLPIFSRNGCVIGDANHQSVIEVDPAYSGDLFSWSDSWMGSNYPQGGPSMVSVPGDRAGPMVRDITVVGNLSASAQQNAFVFYDHNDFVVMERVEVYYMKGSCLSIGTQKNDTGSYTRESRFTNLRFVDCGTPTVPAVIITSTGTGDSSNALSFNNIDVFWPNGPGVVINNSNTSKGVGNIRFYGLRVEGLFPGGSTTGDLLTIGDGTLAGSVANVKIYGFIGNASYAGYNTISFLAPSSGSAPFNISIDGTITSGSGGGINVAAGRSIRLRMADIATTGTAFTVGSSTLVGADIELDMNGRESTITTNIDATSAKNVMIPVRVGGSPNTGALGANSIDLQGVRTSSSQTAQGITSAIGGGANNQVSSTANSGTISGGITNLLDGQVSSISGGIRAWDRGRYGANCYSTGFFSTTRGESQSCFSILRGRSTSTSPVRLTSNGLAVDTTSGTANCWPIPAGYAFNLRFQLAGHDVTDGTSSFAWSVPIALFQRPNTGSATLTLGTPVSLSTGSGNTTSVSAAADTSNSCLNISVTPPNSDTWDWNVTVYSNEVGGT